MQGFLHQLLSGLANGGIYASVALALVMIYQATHLVNFAQGEMAMFSTHLSQFSQVQIYAIAMLGLNILTGFNGQISLLAKR